MDRMDCTGVPFVDDTSFRFSTAASQEPDIGGVRFQSTPGDLHLVGVDRIRPYLRWLSATARSGVDSILPSVPARHALDSSLDSDLKMVERGVRLRSLLPAGARQAAHVLDYAEHVAHRGVQVRTGPAGPVRAVIFDRTVAVVSATTADRSATPTAVVTHVSGVVAALSSLFEMLWEQSEPLVGGCDSGAPCSDRERSMLVAVVAGKTDTTIAREHGVTERTVQRTLKVLRERYGVESRAALAAEAARSATARSA